MVSIAFKNDLLSDCCLQTDCFVCKAEGSRCLFWLRRRMLPRGYVFSHKDGQSDHIFQHILPHTVSQQRRIEAHLNVTNVYFSVLYLLFFCPQLSQQILNLFHACEQQNDDLEKKEQCRAALQRDIQTILPFFLAGSSLNGFGSRSSDADLCLVIEEGTVNHRTDAVYVLSLVRKLFYTLSYIERPQLIRAKVPILKFRDRVSGVEFDLNFNNTVGIRNTFLLRTYAYVEKRVRPIILVIKKWASHHRINDASRGTLSSYTLVLMVLHYLQTLPEPVIPCLQMDYPECFNPTMDIHLVPSGPSNILAFVSKNQSSLGDLLLGFLKYYATVFKWDKHVISVREAKALPKTSCREWRDKFICVEEPFDRTNTARAVHEKVKFETIKAEFTESYQVLQLRKDLNFILPLKNTRPKR
uniref:polynucleotide adenylyltransferase n=1 Tax=Sinocyclocheilus anshuiensis TaxID=1608454 RepID=A0A671L2H6_9TELE